MRYTTRVKNNAQAKNESQATNGTHKAALRWLSLTFFILLAVPMLNVKIGSLPIYAIDFFIFMTWIYARQDKPPQRLPLQGFVIFILVAMFSSELLAGIQLGTLLQPLYLTGRTMLAISLFFSVPAIIQTKEDLMTLLKFGMPAVLITALLMIMTSVPFTQGLAFRYILSNSFLLPSAERIVAIWGSANVALRGQSLVGISILSAAFLNSTWSLIFLLRSNEALGPQWRTFLSAALIIVPLGIVMSYSRGAIAGLVMIVVVVLLFNSNKVRQPVVLGVGIMLLFFSWIGWESESFKFEWLQEKTTTQLANPYKSHDMTDRIYAYSEPFQLVLRDPIFLVLGEGNARQKIPGAPNVGLPVHAVFAAATYGYGMLAAFAYIFLLFGAFRLTWAYAWRSKEEFVAVFASALLASLFGFSSWFILGPAAVTEMRGAELLFFMFGLVAVQPNFARATETVETNKLTSTMRRSARLTPQRRQSPL